MIFNAPEFFYCALADGIRRLFTCFGKWNAKLDLKKVLAQIGWGQTLGKA